MDIATTNDLEGKPLPAPCNLTVEWQRGMDFDGRTARFEQSVVASTPGMFSQGEMTQFRLNTATMAVQLQKTMRFSESKTQEQPQVEAIRCEGGVAMDSRTFDARQQLVSHDQMQVEDLGINKLGGGLTGGRGWINTVRYGSADLLPGQPNAANNAAAKADQFYCLHVKFEKSMTGNILFRQVTFRDHVLATFAPVDSWDAKLTTNDPSRLGPKGVVATCDELFVKQMLLPVGDHRAIELYAIGNARVEGAEFTALASSITYAQAKEILTLEGRGRGRPNCSCRNRWRPGETSQRAEIPLFPWNQGHRGRRSANAGSPVARRQWEEMRAILMPPLPPTSPSTADEQSPQTGDSPSFHFPRVARGKSWFSMGALFFLVIWLILMVAGRSDMLRDPGTFWHVVVGNKMLASGRMIHEDCFSFTRAGHPWVADQWLAECGMALVHRLAGWDGLLLVAAALLAGVYTWIAARLLRAGLHPLVTILLLAAAILLGAPQFHVRPLIATIALLSVTFGWLVDVESGSRRLRQLWWLVPLFILWTNVHGGMLGGLGTAALCLGGWWIAAAIAILKNSDHAAENSRQSTTAGTLWRAKCLIEPIALLLALAATTLVSPYGVAMPRQWLETLAMPLPKLIAEHAPLDLTESIGWGTLALAAGYLATLIGVFPQRPRVTWLVPLVWFVLALSRVRNASLFGVTAVIALADMLPYSAVGRWLHRRDLLAAVAGASPPLLETGSACQRETPPDCSEGTLRTGQGFSGRALVLPAIVMAVAMMLKIGGVPAPVIGHGWVRFDPAHWPIELLPFLEDVNRSSPEGTRIFNDMNFGGFLIYHAPRLRIFVDDRCPLYGTPFLLACERAGQRDPAQIDHWRRQYGFAYALVQTGEPFDRYLSKSAGWSLMKRSSVATLYRHK